MPKASVLLADDNPDVLEYVRALLENDGFFVAAAVDNGVSALREYERCKPDLLILDISMGPLGGIEVARQIQNAGCRAKIVFLTVHEDFDYLSAAMGAGALGYVVKPRLNVDLVNAVRSALDHKLFVSPGILASST